MFIKKYLLPYCCQQGFSSLYHKSLTMTTTTSTSTGTIITPAQLLEHWQGDRRLTRKLIEMYPEEHVFTYSLGGMRPFSGFVYEFMDMAIPGLTGVATGKWEWASPSATRDRSGHPDNKKDLLIAWDQQTDEINKLWEQVPAERFQQIEKAFGQWEAPVYQSILYWIDNEIHHRAQAYVYLRNLGIEPPFFWDRS